MKKFKIIFATVMLGIATVGGYQAYEASSMTNAESIFLENVEALATRNEIHPDCPNGCISSNRWCYSYEPVFDAIDYDWGDSWYPDL